MNDDQHPTDQQLDEWLRECTGTLLWSREGGIRMALIEALKKLRAKEKIADEAMRFYDALDIDRLDPEYFGSGSEGRRYRGLRDAIRAYRGGK